MVVAVVLAVVVVMVVAVAVVVVVVAAVVVVQVGRAWLCCRKPHCTLPADVQCRRVEYRPSRRRARSPDNAITGGRRNGTTG